MNRQLTDAIEASKRGYAGIAYEAGTTEEALLRAALGLRRYFSVKQIERLATVLEKKPDELGLASRHPAPKQAPARKTKRKARAPKVAPAQPAALVVVEPAVPAQPANNPVN